MYLLVILMGIHYIAFGREYIIDSVSWDSEEGVSWEEAEQNCQSTYNSHLASIHSLTDNENVKSLCRQGVYSPTCWIGLKYSEDNGQFEWTDGTDLNYTNWYEYAPSTATDDDGIKAEQCTRIMLDWPNRKSAAQWEDVICSGTIKGMTQRKYICNKPSKAELGQTLCVSGLSEAYQILNGDWEAIGISEYFPDFEELGPYDECIDSGYNICWYTLETIEDSYFMWINPEYGPIIFHQSLDNYDTYISLLDDIIFGCTKDRNWVQDYVDDECDVFDAQWGNSGYENIKFTYGEC